MSSTFVFDAPSVSDGHRAELARVDAEPAGHVDDALRAVVAEVAGPERHDRATERAVVRLGDGVGERHRPAAAVEVPVLTGPLDVQLPPLTRSFGE